MPYCCSVHDKHVAGAGRPIISFDLINLAREHIDNGRRWRRRRAAAACCTCTRNSARTEHGSTRRAPLWPSPSLRCGVRWGIDTPTKCVDPPVPEHMTEPFERSVAAWRVRRLDSGQLNPQHLHPRSPPTASGFSATEGGGCMCVCVCLVLVPTYLICNGVSRSLCVCRYAFHVRVFVCLR